MKKFIWSFFAILCVITACQRYESYEQPILSEDQETASTERTNNQQSYNFVSNAIESTTNRPCCWAEYCKYITTPLGNILCGYDYSNVPIPVGSFTFLVVTPASDAGNPTVKVSYRLRIDEVYYALPTDISPAPVTVYDGIIPDGFEPTCLTKSVWINPGIVPNCSKRYNIVFQVIRGMSNGTSQVCTTITQNNVNLCL